MLGVLQNDPNNIHKRLGDGYYEQKLINEQINRLTGFRRLDGYSNDEAQFKALMDSGIIASQELGLTLGVSLTPDQVSRLTSDIVWLETQTVTLADGSTQTVLVPKVYVLARKGDVNTSGSLLSANQINLDLQEGTLTNSGTIAGRQVVVLNARDINNSGQLQADKIGLTASNNINFNGGTAQAGNVLIANANNINLNTTTSSAGDKQNGTTVVDRVAALYVSGNTEGNGILALNAQNDLNLNAAAIGNDAQNGFTQLRASHNLNLGTVTSENHEKSGAVNDRNHRHVYQTEEVGSHIQTQSNAVLHAGNDMNIRQGTIDSQNGQVALEAGQDIHVTEGRKTLDMDVSIYTKSNNVISSTKTLDQYQGHHDEALGSTITGKTIVINAGNNALIQGSNIVSDEMTSLSASKDVAIVAAQNHYTDNSYHQVKKSGLMGTGGLGFSIGSKKTIDDTDQTSLIHTGSTVGSLKGNTTIIAGNHYTQKGSTVSSPEGNNLIAAKNIDIEAAQNRYATDSIQTFEQKGLTVALNVPVVHAIQSAVQATKNINASKNDRVNAMAAANAAWQGYQLTKEKGTKEKGTLDNASTAVFQALNGDAKQAAETSGISLTYGEQKSRNEAHSRVTEAQASQIIAGGKTTLIATGNGEQSNINIKGSDIAGKAGTILIADNQINLQSAEQSDSERSHNKSSGWNAGIKAGYENGSLALGFTAGGNVGKGKGNGNGNGDSLTHRNSHIGDKGSQTLIQSGGNTIIKGAQVLGNGIQIDAQNLTIASRQDTETYQGKQQNANAQITIGYGVSGSADYNQSKINADHASVTEQSGIFAGDDGYQVNVKEHTDLKGGIITSSQSAEDRGKNRFSTGTLTASDIQNHSHYDGESIGLGGGIEINGGWNGKTVDKQGNPTDSVNSSVGYGNDSDSQESVTRSGIHTRNIHIGSDTAGEQVKAVYTDTTTETAQQNLSRLKNTFDKEEVQKELDVQRTVSQSFSKNVQTANAQINQHLDSLKAQLDKGEISQTEYDSKVASWQKGQVLLNSIATGLSAPTQSATGIAAATASPALSYQIGQTFKKHDAEGTPAHILAHAVLGAAVATAGDNNALAGALSTGGAEAAAPMISQYLYGEKDGSKLTAEQKETVTAITGLLGTATGAMVRDSATNAAQGNLNADSSVKNNKVNKKQAGTVSGFINFFNNTKTKMGQQIGENAEKSILRLDNTNWFLKPNVTPPFNNINDRYIYTEKGGWIDMVHFLFYAGKAYSTKKELEQFNQTLVRRYGIPKTNMVELENRAIQEAVQAGYWQEKFDSINPSAQHSAYSYEDLPSDKFGAIFGARYFDPKSPLSFGQQVTNFFNNELKATRPEQAPNYHSLPEYDDGTSSGIQNKTTTPFFIK